MPCLKLGIIESYMEKMIWQPVIHGRKYNIVVHYFVVNKNISSATVPVIVLNGIGEGKYSASKSLNTLTALGVQSVYSVILPFSKLPADEQAIALICEQVPVLIAQRAMLDTGTKQVDLIARSQGGGAAILAASKKPEIFRKIALIAPFGLTNELLGPTTLARRNAILWRLTKNALKNIELDYGAFRGGAEVGGSFLLEFIKNRLPPSFNAALKGDLQQKFLELSARYQQRIALFTSVNDKVFNHHEYKLSLPESVNIIPTSGPHAASTSKVGQAQLAEVVGWL